MNIHHALMLNFHQPLGNLDHLMATQNWEVKEILWAIDRIPRSLWGYEDIARVNISFSGTLLETIADPGFQGRAYGITQCGSIIWYYQNTKLFEILGTGYYHPVFPLIPREDWNEQVNRWQGIGRHLFARPAFSGFWPPEMGFCMEMIPLLREAGYRYVIVDSNHVEPIDPMRWEEIRYCPHIARYGDSEIIVVVRDRELSDAQEAGMDWGWFSHEVNERVKHCSFEPLVTTCSDGDNGGWFRNTQNNFWSIFYRELLDKTRAGGCNIHPVFISDYLARYGARGRVHIHTGAWNTGWHDGREFVQWTGSHNQKDGLAHIARVSAEFHEVQKRGADCSKGTFRFLMNEAHWHLLRAQTSCNFFWGYAWVNKSEDDLALCREFIGRAGEELGGG